MSPPTILASGAGSINNGSGKVATSWTDTIPSGTNYLVCVVHTATTNGNGSKVAITSPSTVSLTQLESVSYGSTSPSVAIFGIVDPPLGPVTITATSQDAASVITMIAGTSISLGGVGSVENLTYQNNGQNASPTLTTGFTAPSSLVIGALGTFGTSNTTTNLSAFNQAQLYHSGTVTEGPFMIDVIVGYVSNPSSPSFSATASTVNNNESFGALAIGFDAPTGSGAVVVFDAASSGATSTSGTATANLTVGASASALVAEVTGYYNGSTGNASLTTHTCTVGGTPMSLLGIFDCGGSPGSGWVELWGLMDPPIGAQSVVVTEATSGGAVNLNVTATSYRGVSGFGTPVTNSGTGTAVSSGNIVSVTGNKVVSAQGAYNRALNTPNQTQRYDQPNSGNGNYVTLLVQDAPGAGTVGLTCSAGLGAHWGSVSVNLIAGRQATGYATMAMTLSAHASGAYAGNGVSQGSSLAMTTTAHASGLVTHLGPPVRYVGATPTTGSTVIPASYAQRDNSQVAVTPVWLAQQVTSIAGGSTAATGYSPLVNQAAIEQLVGNYETQSEITSTLAGYIPKSALGANNGIAQSDSIHNQIPSNQLPTLVLNSLAKCYDLASNGSQLVSATTTVQSTTPNINEIILAQISVPDPGYPWWPLPFAYVRAASGGTATLDTSGTGNIGCLTVMIEGVSSTYYGVGLCTDDINPSYYPVVPYGLAAQTQNLVTAEVMTPATYPPLPPTTTSGATVFQLGACNLPGAQNNTNLSYFFSGANLTYFILVIPAVHS